MLGNRTVDKGCKEKDCAMLAGWIPTWLQNFEKEAGYTKEMKKIRKLIYHVYKALLWFWGFAEGEHITDMLRRQKQRLGNKLWWAGVSGIFGFLIWLVLHVIEVW